MAVANVAPTDPKPFRFVKLATRSPEVVTFEAADGGKTNNYLIRGVNTKGETGPWSVVASATIPAVGCELNLLTPPDPRNLTLKDDFVLGTIIAVPKFATIAQCRSLE